MARLRQAVIDIQPGACAFKSVTPESFAFRPTFFDLLGHGVFVPRRRELRAVIGENSVHFIRNDLNELS